MALGDLAHGVLFALQTGPSRFTHRAVHRQPANVGHQDLASPQVQDRRGRNPRRRSPSLGLTVGEGDIVLMLLKFYACRVPKVADIALTGACNEQR